jgi:hypothetical protein
MFHPNNPADFCTKIRIHSQQSQLKAVVATPYAIAVFTSPKQLHHTPVF